MFDISNMFLMSYMSKIDLGQGIFTYEILTLILIMGLFNFVRDKVTNMLPKGVNYLINKIKPKYTNFEIVGWEFLNNGLYTFEYPHNMTAINYYIYDKNKSKNFRYFNSKRNGVYYSDDMKDGLTSDSTPNFILGETFNILVDDDIYISVYTEDIRTENSSVEKKSILNWKISMIIKSYKHESPYVQNFISKCILEYEKYTTSKSKDKTYHFIYQGKSAGKLVFSTKIISDFSNPDNKNYETFDNIHHDNKEMLIKDINRLHDTEYYKRTGLKRKKGYLFYGKPGTGKTATVMAMSNFDKRHIIEVPLSRVKTNNELEAILTLSQINNIKFSPHNVILLFDELDIGTKLNRKHKDKDKDKDKDKNADTNADTNDNYNDNNNDDLINQSEEKNNRFIRNIIYEENEIPDLNKDKLSLDTLLSRFDGIGNYAGLIIIGTTNNKNNIDPALYRDGRLSLVEFNYASIDDIQNIIKQYYQIEQIEPEIFQRIQLLNQKISHAQLRYKLEQYDDINYLLDYLEKVVNDNTKSTNQNNTKLVSVSVSEAVSVAVSEAVSEAVSVSESVSESELFLESVSESETNSDSETNEIIKYKNKLI